MAGRTSPDLDMTTMQYSEPAIRHNTQVLEYSRTCQSALSGAAAGILGLTSLYGFAFYFICSAAQSAIWWTHSTGLESNFVSKWQVADHSLVGGLFTYVLLWVFFYGMVHVY